MKFKEKILRIYQELSILSNRKSNLHKLLDKLNLRYNNGDLIEYRDFFMTSKHFNIVELPKLNLQLALNQKGLDYWKRVHDRLEENALNKGKGVTNMNKLKEELISTFKLGEIEGCFSSLEENKIQTKELIIIQSEWNNQVKLKRTGQISAEYTKNENRIRRALFDIILQIH